MSQSQSEEPLVGIIMGSTSDWEVMKLSSDIIDDFRICKETLVVSAHRTPDRLFDYASTAHSRGLRVIIAGAGGAAHLPGMVASKTHLPVLGVPIVSGFLGGIDSLLSIAQMPKGVPVATFAVGKAGAINAALFAIAILSTHDKNLEKKLIEWRKKQTEEVPQSPC